jgi:hypothetical protein
MANYKRNEIDLVMENGKVDKVCINGHEIYGVKSVVLDPIQWDTAVPSMTIQLIDFELHVTDRTI